MSVNMESLAVKNYLEAQNARLNDILDQIPSAIDSITAYIEDRDLEGLSYNAHKYYLREGHVPFLDSLKVGINAVIIANESHIRKIDSHLLPYAYYNQRLIHDNIEWANRSINQLEYMIKVQLQVDLAPELQSRINFLRIWRDRQCRLESYLQASNILYDLAETAIQDVITKLLRIEHAQECAETGSYTLPTDTEMTLIIRGERYITASQLQDFGWTDMSSEEIAELNYLFHKYGITSIESITLFFATCGHESDKGKRVIERLNVDGTTEGNNTVENRGAGYIQLTHADSQRHFLKSMDDTYSGTDLAEYISQNYAWESACWYWGTVAKTAEGSINNYVAKYGASEGVFFVTQCWVNGWPDGLTNEIAAEIVRDNVEWAVVNGRLKVENKDVCLSPIGWEDREMKYNEAIEVFK